MAPIRTCSFGATATVPAYDGSRRSCLSRALFQPRHPRGEVNADPHCVHSVRQPAQNEHFIVGTEPDLIFPERQHQRLTVAALCISV